MRGSFSQISPERLPATKHVLTCTSAGRFILLANAMVLSVPLTLVLRAASSGGLNVTRPEEFNKTSMSSAMAWARSAGKPRFS